MKKFIQWLAKFFNAKITVIKTVEKEVEVVKEVPYYLPPDGGIVEGDIQIRGNLHATGNILAEGYIKAEGFITAKGVAPKN